MPAIPLPDFLKLPRSNTEYNFKLNIDQVYLIDAALQRIEVGIAENLPMIGSEFLKQQALTEINKTVQLRGYLLHELNKQVHKEMWGEETKDGR